MRGAFVLLLLGPYLLSSAPAWVSRGPSGLPLPRRGSPPSKSISNHLAKMPAEGARLLKLIFWASPPLQSLQTSTSFWLHSFEGPVAQGASTPISHCSLCHVCSCQIETAEKTDIDPRCGDYLNGFLPSFPSTPLPKYHTDCLWFIRDLHPQRRQGQGIPKLGPKDQHSFTKHSLKFMGASGSSDER